MMLTFKVSLAYIIFSYVQHLVNGVSVLLTQKQHIIPGHKITPDTVANTPKFTVVAT